MCEDQSRHSGDGVRLCGSAAHDWLSHTQLPNQPGRRACLTFPSLSSISHFLTRKQLDYDTDTTNKKENVPIRGAKILASVTDICRLPIVHFLFIAHLRL